ncbi:MAG: hypothetical protein ABL995_06360 [Bryobacteraceae bacterium]
MSRTTPTAARAKQGEPRWPALLALLGASFLFYALPPALRAWPDWLVILLVAGFASPGVFLAHLRQQRSVQIAGHLAVATTTIAMIGSLYLLVSRLPLHQESPPELLRAATALWISNILVFAAWYWRLDAGGPHQRDLRESHTDGAFLFPQMTLDPKIRVEMGEADWAPNFVDYLFLAFTTSTAFSPTDVPVLSRWAKGLMIIQSLISLTTIALLAARAVNIL